MMRRPTACDRSVAAVSAQTLTDTTAVFYNYCSVSTEDYCTSPRLADGTARSIMQWTRQVLSTNPQETDDERVHVLY